MSNRVEAAPAIPGGPPNAAEVLGAGLAEQADREALVGRHGRFTWAELDREANQAAHALASLGVGPGERVAMSLPNDVDIVVGFLACMRLGAIWLGVSLVLAPPEKEYLLGDSGASVVLATLSVAAELRARGATGTSSATVVVVDPGGPDDEWRARVAGAETTRPDIAVDPHAPAAIAYTSGTTGRPKGAVHSQHNLLVPGAVPARGASTVTTTGSASSSR